LPYQPPTKQPVSLRLKLLQQTPVFLLVGIRFAAVFFTRNVFFLIFLIFTKIPPVFFPVKFIFMPVSSIFAMVNLIFTTVPLVFATVRYILSPVTPILHLVSLPGLRTHRRVMRSIPGIFPAIANILTAVATVFLAV